MSGRALRGLVFASALLTHACTPEVGPCDDLGEQLVVDGEGRILYAGQALVNGSCGAGRCHSDAAEGADREGVPALTTQTHSHDHSGGSGCDIEPAEYLVNITNPDESYLLHKLGDVTIPESQRRICGKLMPSGQPPLTRGTALVRAWIEAGGPPPAP